MSDDYDWIALDDRLPGPLEDDVLVTFCQQFLGTRPESMLSLPVVVVPHMARRLLDFLEPLQAVKKPRGRPEDRNLSQALDLLSHMVEHRGEDETSARKKVAKFYRIDRERLGRARRHQLKLRAKKAGKNKT